MPTSLSAPTSATERHLVTSDDTPIGQLVIGADGRRVQRPTSPAYVTTAKTAALLLGAGSLLMVVTQRATARDAAAARRSGPSSTPAHSQTG